MSKAKLRKTIRRLKREKLDLIIECNAARARAGSTYEELLEAQNTAIAEMYAQAPKLDG